MTRDQFLASCAAFPLLPYLFKTGGSSSLQNREGFTVTAGEGRHHGHIPLKGVNRNLMDMKVSGSDSLGGMTIFEQISRSPGFGTPLHVHYKQDEVFYVLDGNYAFRVGEKKFRLGKGDSIFLPMNVPHAWTQLSRKGRMTVIFQPAGKMEQFFLTLSGLDHEPGKDEIAKIFLDHEMEVVGPPLEIG
ncbi:MAG: cupin domain-containing protein [Flavobacteriaceae bacterium]|nr:cupin domain-containing protein [Flavobacteriaceae bacterium]